MTVMLFSLGCGTLGTFPLQNERLTLTLAQGRLQPETQPELDLLHLRTPGRLSTTAENAPSSN